MFATSLFYFQKVSWNYTTFFIRFGTESEVGELVSDLVKPL